MGNPEARILRYVGIAAGVLVLATAVSASSLSPEAACSVAKAKAAGRAMICLAKETNLELYGVRPAEPESCTTKLTRAFEKAEERGGCALIGDSVTAGAALIAAEDRVLDLIRPATTQHEIDCATAANRIGSRYANCRARAWAKVFSGQPPPMGMWAAANEPCYSKSGGQMSTLSDNCSTPDFDPLQIAEGVGGAYLAGASFASRDLGLASLQGAVLHDVVFDGGMLSSADMRGADLSGIVVNGTSLYGADLRDSVATGAEFTLDVIGDGRLDRMDLTDATFSIQLLAQSTATAIDLSGASFTAGELRLVDLTNADVGGAVIAVTLWANVTCPDGTNSNANAGTCCGHHVGDPPAACGS